MEIIITIVGFFSIILTLCQYIFPSFFFINLFLGKIELKEVPIIDVSILYVNNLCWYIYGDIISDKYIKICNKLCILICLALFLIYIICESKLVKKE